ncbi:MAG: HEAT repeat domain-containing protein [Gemmataceae bacterium]|nr:HEAT repeat domain-containing protein [Gemmataceae bacterium]
MHRLRLTSILLLAAFAIPAAAQNDWSAKLSSSDRKQQLAAIDALMALGPKAEGAVKPLVTLLDGKDEELRLHASMALGSIGAAAIEPTVALMSSKDDATRFYAVWTLGWMGTAAKGTTKHLAAAIDDPSPLVRRKAAFALGRVKPEDTASAIAALAKALADENADVRIAAGEALPEFGAAALPALTKALESATTDEGKLAVGKSVAKLGGAAAAAVPLLGKAFRSLKTPATMTSMAEELSHLGKPAVAELTETLKLEDMQLVAAALRGLQKANPDGAPAIVDALGDKRREVRIQAAVALGQMNLPEKMVVIGLSYAAKQDSDADVRVAALQSIGNLGSGAKLALPGVEACLADLDGRVRQVAFFTLTRMGVNPRDSLVKALQSDDERARIPIAGLMLKQNMEAEEAMKVLATALKHEKKEMRVAAAAALADVPARVNAETMNEVVAALSQTLKEDDLPLKIQAARALGQFGKSAFPVLYETLKTTKDPALQTALLRGLRARGFREVEAVPTLIECLKSSSAEVRWQSAFILANIGPQAKEAIEPLQTLANDGDRTVAIYARNALKRIQR